MNEDMPKRNANGRYSAGTRLPRRGSTRSIERDSISTRDIGSLEHGVGRVFALVVIILILFNIYNFILNQDTFEYRGFEYLLNTLEDIGNDESLVTIDSWKELFDVSALDLELPSWLDWLAPVLEFFWIPIKFLLFLILSMFEVFAYLLYFINIL